jgi:hypothetical protein
LLALGGRGELFGTMPYGWIAGWLAG